MNKSYPGTSQTDRPFEALDFEYVKIDERSLEDLLVFASDFSKLIRYYNLNNTPEGDWSEFLDDETVILALILDIDLNKIETDFKTALYKATLFNRTKKKKFYCQKCFEQIHQLSLDFQQWFQKLKAIENYTRPESHIKQELKNFIGNKLGDALRKTKSLQYAIGAEKTDFSEFDSVWKLEDENDQYDKPEESKNLFQTVIEELESIFQIYYETLLYLKRKAPEYLKQSLQKNNHYPEMGLLIAFFKLYKITQGDINAISKRHLEFYYSNVLKQESLTALGDKLYLAFELYDGIPMAEVKKGTAFPAGEDEKGNSIHYLADEDFLINRIKIQKLRMVYIDKKKINIRGTEKEFCTKILSLDVPIENSLENRNEKIKSKSYAAFGETQKNKGLTEKTMENSKLGFGISSPALFLHEGYREIFISLRFSKESYLSFIDELVNLSHSEKTKEDELFVKLFLEAFIISITSEVGWLNISRYVLFRENESHTLTIKFDLDSSNPAIVAFTEELHHGCFNLLLPVIKIELNPDAYIYPYSILNPLLLDEIVIDSKVSGVKKLALYNNMGQISSDSPFYPFGALPRAGSYLLIGNNEVFQKSPNDFSITIDWFDLPKQRSGFFGYYKEYNLGIDNTSFEAKVSILEGGIWKPEEIEQHRVKLFRTKDDHKNIYPTAQGTLCTRSVLTTVYKPTLKLSPNYNLIKEEPVYSSTSRNGFIKLELSNPEHAFGHEVYPSRLSEAAINNSKTTLLRISNPKILELPKPPYAPQIKSISLNYTSSAVISLRDRTRKKDHSDLRGEVYHIHPYGEQAVYPDTAKQFTTLLPEYNFEGSLLVGLSEVHPSQSISFLIELQDELSTSSEQIPAVVEWYYLAHNEWYYIKPSEILKEETNGFMKTGIIKLQLPKEINQSNTILEPDFFWIRAVVHKNATSVSRIVSIHTQSLSCSLRREPMPEGQYLNQPLKAFSINRSVNNIEGVQTILQPINSFNGRAKETSDNFYIRVAEKLRHKQRAVLSWDYERIILDKFPEINKVACLPNMNSGTLDAPGNILLIVTPRFYKNSSEPIVGNELLFRIKKYIQKLISPFIKVEVRSPVYERIRIICSVKFTDGYNYGYFLQKLNEDINRYLKNNSVIHPSDVVLGGKISLSDVLSFMRTLSYIEFITKFSVTHTMRDFQEKYQLLDTAKENEVKDYVQASKPWSVLVPAEEHQITVLSDKKEESSRQAGIELLELGQDFIVE